MEKKYKWIKPDRKMTMEELWARFEYDPDYEDEDPAYERVFYDRYGNPTYGTLCALYEDKHDIGETFTTLEELFADFEEVRSEVRAEMEHEKYAEAK